MKVAVLGAGVGGLAVAIALRQAGIDVVVYERHAHQTDMGAGIVCWPNASFVLKQLGLLDAVAEHAGEIHAMNRYTHSGEKIGSLDVTQLNLLMNYPSYAIIRKDLMTILSQQVLGLGIEIRYSHQALKISTHLPNEAMIEFNNGTTVQADLIVGADGRMNSVAREYVHNDNSPVFQGFVNWVGVYNSSEDIFEEKVVADYWGTGDRFGIVPVSTKKAYWAGGTVADAVELTSNHHYKDELNQTFKDWPEPIAQVIQQTPISAINKIYVHDHNPITSWHKNNVVLLGDAAHAPLPTSGQGACQALEDAWHLAQCLAQSLIQKQPMEHALSQYTELRQQKTAGIIMGGRHLAADIFNVDPIHCLQRNQASKANNYEQMVVGMANSWSYGLNMGV